MNGQLVGIMHKKGTFTDKETGELVPYDNLELVILVPSKIGGQFAPVEAIGVTTEKKAKCAYSSLSDVFGTEYKSISDLDVFIGSQIEFFYDGSKKICKVLTHE
jgi:hypothetical protein